MFWIESSGTTLLLDFLLNGPTYLADYVSIDSVNQKKSILVISVEFLAIIG